MTTAAPITRVISILGSQANLARTLGRRPSTVTYWMQSGKIPADAAVELEKATSGKVPRWVSRPDLWQAPKRKGAAK